MPIRIRPGLTVVWRSPDSLQFGAPEAEVVLDRVDAGIEWLVARLRAGTTRRAAMASATRHGTPHADARAALEVLAPVIVEVDAAGRPRRHAPRRLVIDVVPGPDVVGRARDARCIASMLRDRGFDARCGIGLPFTDRVPVERTHDADGGDGPDADGALGCADHLDAELTVLVADFAVPPAGYQPLLCDDVEHVAVIARDDGVLVTPRIRPGRTPCLRCDELHRLDRDPAWYTVAAQLLTRRCSAVTDAEIAAAIAVAAQAGTFDAADGGEALLVQHAIGTSTPLSRPFHDGCGCRGLPGIATPIALPRDRRPARS